MFGGGKGHLGAHSHAGYDDNGLFLDACRGLVFDFSKPNCTVQINSSLGE